MSVKIVVTTPVSPVSININTNSGPVQNNEARVKRIFAPQDVTSEGITTTWLATYLSANHEFVSPFTISETQTPVIFYIRKTVTGGVEEHVFFFSKGKGTWGGTTGGVISANDFYKLPVVQVPVTNLIGDPITQTVNYELAPGQSVMQWLNSQNPSIVLQSQDDGYVVFTDGETSYLWLGVGGQYGLSELQSTVDDFQLLDSVSPMPGTPPLNQVTLQGAQSDQPIMVVSLDANKYIEVHGDHLVLKGNNGKQVKAFFLNVPEDEITNLAFSQYKTTEFTAEASGDNITRPELIGATEIFMIKCMSGNYDNQYLTDAGATIDSVIGKLTIPDFTFEAHRQYEIKFK